jgi:hypothetical protein
MPHLSTHTHTHTHATQYTFSEWAKVALLLQESKKTLQKKVEIDVKSPIKCMFVSKPSTQLLKLQSQRLPNRQAEKEKAPIKERTKGSVQKSALVLTFYRTQTTFSFMIWCLTCSTNP